MDRKFFIETVEFIRGLYSAYDPVPLHAPVFAGNEKRYLEECIDSTYVSYVGRYVTDIEEHVKKLTGAKNAVAIVNGTAALQMTFMAAGVEAGDEIVTQALTFAGTAAGIRHAGAEPVFVDVDRETMGMSPESLESFLARECALGATGLRDKATGKRIAAVVPMHTFGHPVRIEAIQGVCEKYGIQLIEDAAESIGSKYRGRQTGTFGRAAILSFNGNRMVVTDDDALAERVRHLSTTAKVKHRWEFFHDEAGYNLRMPNVNAAIGCAQMEYLDRAIRDKRETASLYGDFFKGKPASFFREPSESESNYWLNCIVFPDRAEREAFLEYTNDNGVQTRPIWILMNELPPYKNCRRTGLENAEWLVDRVVNIPSGVRPWT
jgi:perosamine synthetase